MNITEIKTRGQLDALERAIDNRIHDLRQNTFEGYRSSGSFSCLGKKCAEARRLLDQIEILLKEVNAIDGVSK